MNRRSRTASKPLPPPTPSEAAFERVLASFDASPGQARPPFDAAQDDKACYGEESACHGELLGCHPEPVEGPSSKPTVQEESIESFVDRLFSQSRKFLARDDFAG